VPPEADATARLSSSRSARQLLIDIRSRRSC
jgi:hypothetical protein